MRYLVVVTEGSGGLSWLCHNLLYGYGTSMYWASVSPSAQEGAKAPFISTFMTVTRKNDFPSLHATARALRRQPAEKGESASGQRIGPGTKLTPSGCSSSAGSLLMVKEFHLVEFTVSENRGSGHNHSAFNFVGTS